MPKAGNFCFQRCERTNVWLYRKVNNTHNFRYLLTPLSTISREKPNFQSSPKISNAETGVNFFQMMNLCCCAMTEEVSGAGWTQQACTMQLIGVFWLERKQADSLIILFANKCSISPQWLDTSSISTFKNVLS